MRRWREPARVIALVTVLGLKFVLCTRSEVECLSAARDTSAGAVIAVCAREYERSRDPATGVALAKALCRAGDLAGAEAIARPLLLTPARADALYILGWVAKDQGRLYEARTALERAVDAHRAEHRISEVAADEQALAAALKNGGRFAEALRMLDRCIADARTSADRMIEGFCHLSAGQTLSAVGFFQAAHQELERAAPLLDADRDRAWLHFTRGNLHQDLGHDSQAVVEFQRALPIAERAQLVPLSLSIHMNLAYSLAETGRVEEAAHHLDVARSIDHQDQYSAQRLNLAGRIAYRRGDPGLALSLLAQADRATDEEDELIEIAVLAARIALGGGDLRSAENWARHGVDLAERIRQAQSALELRTWVLSSRRAPYELRFAALARAGRTEDALVAFDHWHGRSVRDALSRLPDADRSVNLEQAALETDALRALLPSLSPAPSISPDDMPSILAAVRSSDLLAMVVADGEVWRLTSSSNRLHIASLGPLRAIRQAVDRFRAKPTDPAVAEELGALILPDEFFRDSTAALRVILDGPFATLPIAALRRHGRPLAAARPSVRIPHLSAVRCAPPLSHPRRAVVLADARGDLPAARLEASRTAARFGTSSLVGEAATSHALFAAGGADLLHIAVHAELASAGGVLVMRDRAVSALEISARRLGPPLVVLAACGSALANDDEGATSIAMAFLGDGATRVVATLRSVSDDGADEVTRRFYEAGGQNDPVKALAAVQESLADGSNSDWPSFVVYGQDTCPASP
jgi:tetratricopeptide (TPR) repeat protein